MKTIFNKNQMSKSVRFMILALAFASCNDNLEVKITPENNLPKITYNTAECSYGGDILGNGAAFFILDLYNSSNSDIGIFIMGFCTLPSSFTSFKLDVGTYNFATNGAKKTLFPGMLSDGGSKIGTFLYDYTTNKFTFVTGGSLTVELSGNTYTISANFKGEDVVTGKAVNDITVNYKGTIKFTDDTDSAAPVKSTYTATGTPKWLTVPGDRTWSGTLESVEKDGEKWYEISNWGNDDIKVYCDDDDGQITIDNYSKVVENDKYDGYFEVGYMDGGNLYTLPFNDYIVKYDPITKILDFTGTVTDNGKTYEALVGIAAYNKTTGNLESVFSDFYANVKLQLTPVTRSSVAGEFNDAAGIHKNIELIRQSTKPVISKKSSDNIVSGKSGFQKNQSNGLKMIESSKVISSQKEVQKR